MKLHDVDQGSHEWYAIRAGVPTASEFSCVVTSKGERSKQLEGYAAQLAAEAYAKGPVDGWEGNAFTERGKALEAEASNFYAFLMECTPEVVGFVTTDDGLYGCSPDRLIGDDGLLEIKCQASKGHVNTMMEYQKTGKLPPSYVQQVQGQLLVTGREWADVLFYHPKLPSIVIHATPDSVVQAGLIEHIPHLIEERDRVLSVILAAGN